MSAANRGMKSLKSKFQAKNGLRASSDLLRKAARGTIGKELGAELDIPGEFQGVTSEFQAKNGLRAPLPGACP